MISLVDRGNLLSGIGPGLSGEDPFVVDGREDIQTVAQAGLVVVGAMPGGGVHAAGAGLGGHVIGQDQERITVEERMPAVPVLEVFRGKGPLDGVLADTGLGHEGRYAILGQHPGFLPHPDRRIDEIRVEGDGEICRQGPRGRRPDDDRDLAAGQGRTDIGEIVDYRELDIDRRRAVIMVLDLGLGQGGRAGGTPVDRFLVPDDRAGEQEAVEFPGDRRLIGEVHGKIGFFPVAQDPQPLELGLLGLDPFFGIFTAGAALRQLRDGLFLFAQFQIDIVLDRQAVAVPARDVGGVESRHPFRFDDDILEDLIEGGTQVDMPVGIRGAVMQDIEGPAGGFLLQLAIEVLLFPALEAHRLALGQIGLHIERGLGQIEGCPVVHGYLLYHIKSALSAGSRYLVLHTGGPFRPARACTRLKP